MSRSNYTKELVLSNIIGSNPTGIISLNDGNPIVNKNVNIVQNTAIASKENLIKAQNNEIMCNNIEKFETKQKLLKENIISLFLIFLILIIFLFLFVLKKNIKL
jgi:hypothetical protein